jgi:hypothetical protein
MPEPLTCRLSDGTEVLAKRYKHYIMPVTYANRTQAVRKLAQLGVGWRIRHGSCRSFFLAKKDAKG